MAQPFKVCVSRRDEKTGKYYYTKIGAAFPRDRGGFSIKLEAHPIGAEMMVFPPDDQPRESNQTQGQAMGEDELPY